MRVFLLFLLANTVFSIQLNNKGGAACIPSNKCGKCEGDCDSDNDCASGLRCFQRSTVKELVPGCESGGVGDIASTDYCYEPCPSGTEPSAGCTGRLASVLANVGSTSCGIGDGSLDIWVNTAIASNEVYDLQSGDFTASGTITATSAQINGKMRANNAVIDGGLSLGSLSGKVVDYGNIKNGAVHTEHIAANAIKSQHITDNAIKSQHIASGAVGASEIASNAIQRAHIASGAVGASEIASNVITTAHLANGGTFEMHALSAYDGYIRAGTPTWNNGWKVNLDENVWIHHKLEVDGVAYFDSIAHFRGTGSSSMVRKVIWGYSSGGVAVNHAGDIGYAYVYGYDRSDSQSSVAADFDGYIIAKYGVMTRSDRRIKQNIVDVSDISSLNRVLNIPVRNYQYKNQLKRGDGNITGFIAQEIKEVFPEAVTFQTMGIPYIGATFKIFEMNNKTITIATPREENATLVVGDKLNAYIHLPDDDENSHTRYRELQVLTVGDSKTTLQCDECEENESANAIHIYEKIVDDFHVIDKDRIFTLHHGAIQELHREQENLKEKVLNLENTIASLTERLAALEAK